MPDDLVLVEPGHVVFAKGFVALRERQEYLDRGDGVRRRVVCTMDLDAVVPTEVGQRTPPLAPRVQVAIDDTGIEDRTVPAALDDAVTAPRTGLRLEHREVVVEPHSHQGDTPPAG